jgi:tRNA dimethylallyltransferase
VPSPTQSAHPLVVLAGPTASGKTALALELAEEFDGEIVSCDSVSVYRYLEIGSAKPSAEERARVPHHCLDLYDPDEATTAGDWARHARAALEEITGRGRLPIIAGGTGLYLRALLEGLAPLPKRDEALRERLRTHAAEQTPGYLHRLLHRIDPHAAQLIHPNDTPKLIRALEVALTTDTTQTEQWAAGREGLSGYRMLKLGLEPERALLYERINSRAAAMFDRGLVEETDAIRQRFGEECRSLGSLGYSQAMGVLRGEVTLETAVGQAQQGHRNYAKRQLTWFRSDPSMHWLRRAGDDPATQAEALALAGEFVG